MHKGYASQADITIEKPLSVTLSPEFINTLQKNNPRVQAVAEIVTASVSPPPVLILGEYGTGKAVWPIICMACARSQWLRSSLCAATY